MFGNQIPIRESFEGNSSGDHVFSQANVRFCIVNDNTSDLIFNLNGIVVKVKAGENFDDVFMPFNKVTITATGVYRCYAGAY